MDTPLEIRRAKASAEADLLKLEGVTGVGIGEKLVNGQRTGEIAIRVYVKKKKSKSSVGKDQLVPETIGGFPTDVIEREFKLQPARLALDELKLQIDTGTYDPLTGGISVGPCRTIGGYVYGGTLGLVVEDNTTGDRMMLSNFHVMCINGGWSAGDTMAQPSRLDGGTCPADVVGQLARGVVGGQVDGAVARITARGNDCRVTQIGNVSGTALPVLNEAVRKRGRTTELTHGFVDDTSITVTIDYGHDIGNVTLTNQISVEVDPSQSTIYSDDGDSGAVVLNSSGEVIGLHFAGTDDGVYGVANPIAAVLSALDVRLCTPTIVATAPWLDVHQPTVVWLDVGPPTHVWSDIGTREPEFTVWETSPWIDAGGTANKRFDDVKDPAGYDTLMETVQETIDTFQEMGGMTMQEVGGITAQEAGGLPADPRVVNPPAAARPPIAGPGLAPFSMATPHHAAGAQRFEGAAGGANEELDRQIDQLRMQLQALEAQRRGRP